MKVLGIDYGTKRVGVAVSDESGVVALPRAVLVNIPGVVEEIVALARAEGIESIAIGESRRSDGGENVIQREVARFKHTLEGALPDMPIFLQHEGMSTQSARVKIERHRGTLARERRAPAARARARGPADARAAAVILQRFLDTRSYAERHRPHEL